MLASGMMVDVATLRWGVGSWVAVVRAGALVDNAKGVVSSSLVAPTIGESTGVGGTSAQEAMLNSITKAKIRMNGVTFIISPLMVGKWYG